MLFFWLMTSCRLADVSPKPWYLHGVTTQNNTAVRNSNVTRRGETTGVTDKYVKTKILPKPVCLSATTM